MSTIEAKAFDVRVRQDGTIEISGGAAAHTLMIQCEASLSDIFGDELQLTDYSASSGGGS